MDIDALDAALWVRILEGRFRAPGFKKVVPYGNRRR